MNRPRCPRGHFLSRTGTCRCQRPRPASDLRGQRATLRQLYTMTTVPLAGSYL